MIDERCPPSCSGDIAAYLQLASTLHSPLGVVGGGGGGGGGDVVMGVGVEAWVGGAGYGVT